MKPITSIPKPRIALQIGITGHRSNRLGDDSRVSIEATLRALFATIDESVAKIALQTPLGLYSTDKPLIRLISGLADGADRHAIAAAPADWQIAAVLPMPQSEYARDFITSSTSDDNDEFKRLLAAADSVTELPILLGLDVRNEAERAQQYHALGTFLIRQVDVLVAVWDGAPARGPGGTASVVTHALDEGRPVIWIDPHEPTAPRLMLGADSVDYRSHSWKVLESALVDLVLGNILAPPSPAAGAHPHAHAGKHAKKTDRAEAASAQAPPYFVESWPKPMRLPFAYNLLRRLAGAGRWSWPITYPSFAELAESWNGFFATLNEEQSSSTASLDARLRDVLLPRSIWADAFGWVYGLRYRSAYVSTFLLAGLAVPLGLIYLFFLDSPAVLDIKAGFVVLELLIIWAVVQIVRRGVRGRWHDVWLETRELSEMLRLGRLVAPVGALRDLVAAPQAGTHESFASWYARATFRELGLPVGRIDARYLCRVLEAVRATEITEQRNYHISNAKNLHKIDHWLHHRGNECFTATIILLGTYLVFWLIDRFLIPLAAHAEELHEAGAGASGLFHEFLEHVLKPIVSIGAAGLPAFGAAFSGIRAQGDFGGFAERSNATQQDLAGVQGEIETLLSVPDHVSLAETTDVLLTAARIMAKDVGAWQKVYLSKRLTLPA
jgi:hypothetical protein